MDEGPATEGLRVPTESKQSPAFSPAPFPDLTGLRQEAAVRRRSPPVISVQHEVGTGEAKEALQEGRGGKLLALGWLVLLSHLIPQEDIDLGCDVPGGHGGTGSCVRLQVPAATRASVRASRLGQHIADQGAAEGVDTAVSADLSQEEAQALVAQGTYAVVIRTEGGRLHLEATPKVLDEGSAKLVLEELAVALGLLISDPETTIFSAELFPPELRAGSNALPPPLTDDIQGSVQMELFQHQFERLAAKHPDRTALHFVSSLGSEAGATSWTYKELNRRADLLAWLLREQGIGLGRDEADEDLQDVVALCLEKSPETYLAMLGVLKAGAAWSPIDTDWPAARREALLAKCRAKVVLASGSQVCEELHKVLPDGLKTLRLDEVDWSAVPTASTRASHGSNKLAYLIWTSGSTGLPKPVGIQHSAAVQALRSLQRVIPAGDTSRLRYLQFSAYVFDLMIMDCFYAWGLGGTICTGTRSLLMSNLVQLANEVRATHTLLTPAIMAMTPRSRIPSLGVVINGGEKLSQVVADAWSVKCCLLNLYGPAEATLIAMHRRVPERDQVKAPNIGLPLPTVSCHVLNAQGEIALRGATGELVLGGHQCAKGYIGEPDKTADKFQLHPQLGCIYRTGDVSRVLWYGSFEYLGRNDDQIKVNGIRIELLEINSAIKNAHELVRDSETMALPRKGSSEELQIVNVSILESEPSDEVAAIRDDEEAAVIVKVLRQRARDTLPSYMVPSLFLVMTHFPKTSSAKVDRTAIRKALDAFDVAAWEEQLVEDGDDAAAAVTDEDTLRFEEVVRKKLTVVCGLGQETSFTRHTPFMSLGLDSIKAIALSNALSEDGVEVGVLDLLRHPSLAALSGALSSSRASEESRLERFEKSLAAFEGRHGDEVRRRLEGAKVSHVLPVTPLQQGMLVETQLNPRAYWLRRCFRLGDGAVDLGKLGRALQAVARRTEMLRTGFLALQGRDGMVQVVYVDWELAVAPPIEVSNDEQLERFVLQHAERVSTRSVLDGQPPIGVILARHGGASYLVLVAHHSLYDAQSLSLLASAAQSVYEGAVPPELLPFRKALPYLTALDAAESELRTRRWEQLTASFPKGIDAELPSLLDEKADDETSTRGHQSQDRNATTSWPELQRACQRIAVSPRALLQAALARVLSSYCKSDGVVIGDSISLRGASSSLSQAFGPVLTTLPVPVFFKQGATRQHIMLDIAGLHRGVLGHEHIPLPEVKRLLGIDAASILFQCAFVLEPVEDDGEEKRGLLSEWRDIGVDVEHPLALEVLPSAVSGTVTLRLMFDEARISRSSAETLLAQIDAAVSAFVEQPQAEASSEPVQTLELLSHCISSPLPGQANLPRVHAVIEAIAGRQPDSPAIEFVEDLARPEETTQSLSYRQLTSSVRSAGATLLRQGLKLKSVVAVSVPRSSELYVWLLATLSCGFVYLPIDTTLPAERKRLLVKDSGARLVLATTRSRGDFGGDVPLLVVDQEPTRGSDIVSWPSISSEDAAYILYTSGSTGKPKGCVLSHGNLSATLAAFHDTIQRAAPGTLSTGSFRWLARSSEAFDVHLLEALLPLQLGGTVCTAPREQILEDLRHAMHTLAVTHSAVVPSLFFSGGRRIVPKDLPSLKVLIAGGEKIADDILRLWGWSHVTLLNAYGPSETCIGNSMAVMSRTSLTTLIGRPFAGTGYHVMIEREGQLTPVMRGAPGELCISGLQLGSYLDEPPSSGFCTWQSQRLYRTGDLVRMRASGEVDYLGRIAESQQVKLAGVRIELGEVDAVVRESLEPPLKDARVSTQVVLAEGRQQLVSFIAETATTSGGQELQLRPDLASACGQLQMRTREKLPSRMAPRIIALSFIPLIGTSGKMDGKRLREFFGQVQPSDLRHFSLGGQDQDGDSFSATEVQVAKVFEKLLSLTGGALSPSLDLFSMGLDSLSAVSLSAALRRQGLRIDAASIIRQPTIRSIARSAASAGPEQRTEASSAAFARKCDDLTEACREQLAAEAVIPLDNTEAALPCLPLQAALLAQSMSFQESGATGPIPYVHAARYKLGGDVQEEKLREAWEKTLRAHPIYRSVFMHTRHGFAQLSIKQEAFQLPWRSLKADDDGSSTCAAESEKAASDIVQRLSTAPPIRLILVTSAESRKLIVCAHHCIYDGVSWNLLLGEVVKRYGGEEPASRGAPFPEIIRLITSLSDEEAAAFWQGALSDLTITPFPILTGRRAPASEAANRTERTTSRLEVPLAKLRTACREKGVTLQSLTLAAFSKLLAMYTGEDGVTLGLVLSGRTYSVDGIEGTHGPCITTVPLSLPSARRLGARDPAQDVREVQGKVAELLAFQHYPLAQIARATGCEGSQLFNTLFSFLPTAKRSDSSGILSEEQSEMQTQYQVALELQEDEVKDALLCNFDLDPAFVPRAQAKAILDNFAAIVAKLCGLGETSGQRGALSITNPEPYTPQSPSESFIARFVKLARERPEAVAYAWADSLTDGAQPQLTSYGELDHQSDAIAARLAAGECQVAAVYMGRGPLLYATLLGIWKAGKIYMPLDPALPKQRLQYMLSVVQDAVIVTEASLKDGADELGPESVVVCLPEPGSTPAPSNEGSVSLVDLDLGAYILFTSGSTGRPKAARVSQRALAACLYSWERILPHKPWSSRMLQLASPGFDVSFIEICFPLSVGGSFGAAPKDELLDDVEAACTTLGITQADLPASLAATVSPERMPPLEWLMSGGDLISDRTLARWAPRGLVNAWGPTEATIGNTLGFVEADSSRSMIGAPYPTSSLFVLAEDEPEVLPLGAIGELCVGGCQLADGYVGQAQLTADKFIHLLDGTRVYRTGDRGRILVDGRVECLGRMQTGQVKVNGQRLELGEVSQSLRRHGNVDDVETLFLQHAQLGTKQLVAFVTLPAARTNAARKLALSEDEDFRKACRAAVDRAAQEIPRYMVPVHAFALMGVFPKTVNDKVDRKALAALFEELPLAEMSRYDALAVGDEADAGSALSAQERSLAEVLSSFSGVSVADMSRRTSLYELGVDSISGLQLVRHLRQSGLHTSVQQLFRTPTLGQLAIALYGSAVAEDLTIARLRTEIESLSKVVDATKLRLSAQDKVHLLPCSPLQSGLVSQTLVSGGKLYIHSVVLRVAEDRTEQEVRTAWQRVVDSVDILRTSFHFVDELSSWCQAVHSQIVCKPRACVDVTGAKAAATQMEGWLDLDEVSAFTCPPWEAGFFNIGNRLHFGLALHHALYDASALTLLFRRFEEELSGRGAQQSPSFENLLPHLLSGEADVQHWLDLLRGYRPRPLRPARDKMPVNGVGSSVASAELQTDVPTASLAAASKRYGISFSTLAQLVYARRLSAMTRSPDVVFGTLANLRDACAGAEEVIGPALSTVPVRVRFRGGPQRFSQAAQELQSQSDEGRPFRQAALRDVEQGFRQSNGAELALSALFDFQAGGEEAEPIPKRNLELLELEDDSGVQYPLNVLFTLGGSVLKLIARSRSSDLPPEDLKQLLQHLAQDLAQVCSSDIELCDIGSDQRLDKLWDGNSLPQEAKDGPTRHNGKHAIEVSRELLDTVRSVVAEAIGGSEDGSIDQAPFRTLGLDSIASIKVASRLRRRGFRLGVADIIKCGSVISLAAHLQATPLPSKEEVSGVTELQLPQAALLEIEKLGGKVEQVLPTLPIQDFFTAEAVVSAGSLGAFTLVFESGDGQSLDAGTLRDAWTALVKRHPTLRTTFASVEGQLLQIVLDADSPAVVSGIWQIERRRTGSSMVEVFKEHRSKQDAFALTATCRFIEAPQEVGARASILLQLPHACYDAWTIDLLLSDLQALYLGKRPQSSVAVPELAQLLPRHDEDQRRRRDSHFAAQLSRAQTWPAPTDVAPQYRPWTFLHLRGALKGLGSLEAAARRAGCDLQSVLIAAWAKTLREVSGQELPAFGLYHLGRSVGFDGIERLAGPCMTVLPTVVHQAGGLIEEAKQARATLDDTVAFEHTSLADIKRACGFDVERPVVTSFLNLLWSSPALAEDEVEGGPLLRAVPLPEECHLFTPDPSSVPAVPERLRSIDRNLLNAAQDRLSVDVSARRETDQIDVAVRADSDVFADRKTAEEAIRRFARIVAEALGGEERGRG